MAAPAPWARIGADKRAALRASIPRAWRIPPGLLPAESQREVTGWPETSGWLTAGEVAVTGLTASELVPELAAGRLRAEDVARAFCKRASAAHELTNCLSETCFDRALATARARDQHLARFGLPVGPLHGLPVSLKDNFHLRGLDATVGFASHVGDAARADSALAQLLDEAGAVLYVKTNVSTAMMMAETVNNVFGPTLNPRNRQTTSGGSSGGEAALIAMQGSPLGVGSDIGGSVRIPAACTGIFALRPSAGRFPVRHTRSGMPGQEAVQSVNGPMARSLPDLELYSRAAIGRQPWLRDPRCIPLPWRPVDLAPTLTFAVMWHDGMVRPTPPVSRALRTTVSRLKAEGHHVVDWDPVDQELGASLLGRMFVADGGTAIRTELERTGEPWRPEMKPYETATELGVHDMWKLQLERTEFQNRYLDRWNDAAVDAILCPTIPFNGAKHGAFRHFAYTGVFNVLDYSCLSFPTGFTVDRAVDKEDCAYRPLSPVCQQVHDQYDADFMHGLPISLQLVARKLEEEKVLAMGERVLQALRLEKGANVNGTNGHGRC